MRNSRLALQLTDREYEAVRRLARLPREQPGEQIRIIGIASSVPDGGACRAVIDVSYGESPGQDAEALLREAVRHELERPG
jgi:hypothetical protein